MGRTPTIGGNWKMHLDFEAAMTLASDLRNRLGSVRGVESIVFPSFPYLRPASQRLRESAIAVGAQDLHVEAQGAFTSGVSAEMIRSVGCTHVLIGHSERRSVFGDDDGLVSRKLSVALEADLIPVLCIGESLAEREAGQTFSVLERQLNSALRAHTTGAVARMILAYEPVWAIGTGLTATPEQAQEVHAWVRGHVSGLLGSEYAEQLRIQYGGSVKPSNAAGLLLQPDIDGALVGGASLNAESFAEIVRAAR